jgi:hypothetical protein
MSGAWVAGGLGWVSAKARPPSDAAPPAAAAPNVVRNRRREEAIVLLSFLCRAIGLNCDVRSNTQWNHWGLGTRRWCSSDRFWTTWICGDPEPWSVSLTGFAMQEPLRMVAWKLAYYTEAAKGGQ